MELKIFSYAIVVISFLLYLNSIFCGFVFDDVSAIKNNKDVLGQSPISSLLWNDYWGTPMVKESSHKSYRPFTVLTYRINHTLFGMDPWSYHFFNVLLHCIVCYLTIKLYATLTKLCFQSRLLEQSKWKMKQKSKTIQQNNSPDTSEDQTLIIVVATLLFVSHPIHTEAVTGVVGRAELLSAVFFILAILSYLNFTVKSITLSLFFCLLAVASKEQGITVLAVCLFLDIIVVHKLTLDEFCLFLVSFSVSPRRTKLRPLLYRVFVLLSFGAILLFWRYRVMHGQLPYFTAFDNPAAASNFPSRQLTLNYLLPVNLWLLICPNNLLCDWTMGTIPLVSEFADMRNLATLSFWVCYIAISFSVFFHEPIHKLLSVAVAMVTFPFLPASNLFFTVGFVVAERVLYIPSIGFCFLVATGAWVIVKRLNSNKYVRWVWLMVIFVVCSFSLKTVHRNFDWKSEYDLFQSGLKVTRKNAKIWNNIGHALENEGRLEDALSYFTEATNVQVDDQGAYMNVARIYEKTGDKKTAEVYYRKAKDLLPKPVAGRNYHARVAPSNLQVFVKLANLIREDRPAEADRLYEEALRMRPSFMDAHMNRGEILLRLNKPQEALKCYQNALRFTSDNKSDIYFNIGVVQSQLSNKTGAIEAYTYSLVHNPHHVKSLFNSAVIFQETRDPELLSRAKLRTETILKLEPDNLLAMGLFGSIYMDMGENIEAIKWWKNVLAINESERTCLFNLALIYSKMAGKSAECIEAINRLLKFYPNHVKGLLLYGDFMLNRMKNPSEAQKAYARLIDADPNNVEGRHNYCVTLVEQGLLKKAEKCLMDVYLLAPHVGYVQENLARVRRQINIIEISARQKEERKKTNFKQTPVQPSDEETDHLKKSYSPKDEEEIMYVAQPVNSARSAFDEAKEIRKSLDALSAKDDIETKLKRTTEAVRRLKELKSNIDDKAQKECKNHVKKDKVKEEALKILDKLEKEL